MRKRFISGLTAVCMLGILLANSFLSVPASAVIAEVGASVAAGLLMGTLFNQMTGGTGYDFTDAFSDCFSFVVTPHNQFIRDNPDADIYLPDGTPYYVDGQYAAAIELKKGEAEIAKMVQSHWNIAESLGLKTPQETIHAAMDAFNAGLADGSIVIHVDDDGNISMPTTSYCTAVSDIYEKFGVFTNKNGLNRVRTYWTLVSDCITTTFDSWNVTINPYSYIDDNKLFCFLFPYCVQNDQLIFLNYSYQVEKSRVCCHYGTRYNYIYGMQSDIARVERDGSIFPNNDDFYRSVSVSINNSLFYGDFSISVPASSTDSVSFTVPEAAQFGIGGIEIDSSKLQYTGFALVTNDRTGFDNFVSAAKTGAIENKRNDVSIPLTGVENTIGNMGLAGVGTGTAKGTVNVDAKTKDITVTNEQTKEAEKVIEQGNAGDIDTPDVDSITDKFPFSLPFDIYNLVTIFVRDEQKPIFEIPIQTTLDIAGDDYKVDEKIVLDLTQFQLNGVDIIRVFTRTVTYIAFIAFLIKITPHVIKH